MKSGGKIAFRSYHDWLLPQKVIVGILAVSCVLLFIGVVLLAVASGRHPRTLGAAGSVLAGLGGCGIMILLLLCLHAYFIWFVQDESTQTWETTEVGSDQDFPTYAVVNKPSALKNADGSLKKNGKPMGKKVTLAPEVDAQGRIQIPIVLSDSTVGPAQVDVSQQQRYPVQYQPPMYSHPGQTYHSAPIYRPQSHSYSQQSHYQVPPAQYPQQVYPPQRQPLQKQPSPQIRLGIDDDYDNPVETTPMLSQSVAHPVSKRQPEPDLPEPQPLVYPSAKRPMTFEQTSSSKMSIYDNVLYPYPEDAAE